MTLLILAPNARPQIWAKEFKRLDPNLDVRIWPNVDHLEDITYALVWNAPKGVLSTLPNLRIIFSMGAGVDHFFLDLMILLLFQERQFHYVSATAKAG